MVIEIDDKSGFCFGVVQAIGQAEESLSGGGVVYSLGDIVHNPIEVKRLERKGLLPVDHEQFVLLRDATVLIRAHGEPPWVYESAEKHGIKLIDATCPVVARLQRIVSVAHAKMKEVGGQVVILGKKGHAEVVGLSGQVDGDVIVVEHLTDLELIDFSRPVYLLSQTTQSLEMFEQVKQEIGQRLIDETKLTVHDTICRQVANRGPHLSQFASKYDVIIFVSGRKSSNGKVLFGICKTANSNSYLVEDESELDRQWFRDAESVGVCGATSTPKAIMQRVADTIAILVKAK